MRIKFSQTAHIHGTQRTYLRYPETVTYRDQGLTLAEIREYHRVYDDAIRTNPRTRGRQYRMDWFYRAQLEQLIKEHE